MEPNLEGLKKYFCKTEKKSISLTHNLSLRPGTVKAHIRFYLFHYVIFIGL